MIISAMPGGSGSTESRPHELITQEEYNRKLANNEINEETIYLIDDQENIDLSNKADLVDGKVPVAQLPDLEYTPKYNADTAYPADAYCVHKGALWVNTSGKTVQGVEPGTDYNKWNVTYSNENLLDNPWFTVNQRGVTSWSTGYGVDRWFCDIVSNISVADDSIVIETGRIAQKFEKIDTLLGNLCTASVKLEDGSIYSANFIFGYASGGNPLGASGVMFFSLEDSRNIFQASSTAIRAVKVELGPFSTLANDGPPDYRIELAKCQKYFQRIITTPYDLVVLGTAIANTAYDVTFNLALSVPMRTAPTLTYSSIRLTRSNVSSSLISPSSFFVREPYYPNNTHLNLQLHSSGGSFTAGETYAIILYSASTSYLDLSADL